MWKRARPCIEHHVGAARLEVVGGQILRLLDDGVGREPPRDSADLGRLRAEGPGSLWHVVRVALAYGDPVDRDAQFLGSDHRERRLVALAVRERPSAQDRATVLRDLDLAELGLRHGIRDLDIGGHADPELDLVRRSHGAGAAPRAAPGSRQSGAGGRALLRSRRSRTSRPSLSCAGTRQPEMKFLRRTSAGSSPISAAKRSRARSMACAASGRPAPRIEVVAVVLVTTERVSTSTSGIAYTALAMSAVRFGRYAPRIG